MRKEGKGKEENSRQSLLKTKGRERQRQRKREGEKTWEKHKRTQRKLRKLSREQVPCWQRGGSKSSAAEHFDKSSSSRRTWTEVVFHRDEQDVI